ncbi:hypothetical protein G7K_6568-t1 [Saitoella complicata NRRL Y-17804]|uniref:Uncharacterized protein n=1 Tax=Saitoella complicata (strain BCRC 22490 / CBS 7301 / JCM 7358 / NBRC 10748 / NRRL Y-17804) TaxID=698492 RepID=A0A0E9NRT3_SAICN|nr:hypothetical protein G7K_6568-t1 [Saitoella complicata NRRL Y-17804]
MKRYGLSITRTLSVRRLVAGDVDAERILTPGCVLTEVRGSAGRSLRLVFPRYGYGCAEGLAIEARTVTRLIVG